MKFETESGAVYEIDHALSQARKIGGTATEMTEAGAWRRFLHVSYEVPEVVGGSALIVWDAPGKVEGNRATATSKIVRLFS